MRKKYAPWIDWNYKNETTKRDNFYKTARETNDPNDWRLYRQQRNVCNRLNKDNKTKYYTNRLNKTNIDITNDTSDKNDKDNNGDGQIPQANTSTNDSIDLQNRTQDNTTELYNDKLMWRTVADLTNKSKQKPPRLILCDNTITTSLKKIQTMPITTLSIK